jgi:dihydrofolate synthase/folylpolyglutamate synthase
MGLYTSPHLSVVEERIAINGAPCSQAEFAALAAELEEAVSRLSSEVGGGQPSEPTFFEITTAMAFLHFARRRVDAAVLEVGLGGRLDSTNVCRPSVCVITSISFDHTRQLGNTLAAIAGEKAGIIKPGVPVISGVVNDEPRQVIRRVAAESGAPLVERGAEFDYTAAPQSGGAQAGERLDYREPATDPRWELRSIQLGIVGRHQSANAAAAIATARRLVEQGWPISEAALRSGLAAARVPARIEIIGQQPTVIIDVAHNVASIGAFIEVLRERFADRRRVLVFASSRDKDAAGMLRLLVPWFEEIVLTRYVNNPRAMDPPALAEMARAELPSADNGQPQRAPRLRTAADPAEAWKLARQAAGPNDLVCITGSFFLASELRPLARGMTLEPAAPT